MVVWAIEVRAKKSPSLSHTHSHYKLPFHQHLPLVKHSFQLFQTPRPELLEKFGNLPRNANLPVESHLPQFGNQLFYPVY